MESAAWIAVTLHTSVFECLARPIGEIAVWLDIAVRVGRVMRGEKE